MMQRIAAFVFAIVTGAGMVATTARVEAAPRDHAAAGAVSVTVNYKGSGTVDSGHRVWVWLFDTPSIGPGSMPIAELSVDKNGGTATFDVGVDRVWIAVAFDDKAQMSGNQPPPSGSPISIYSTSGGAPDAVTPGAKGTVTLTFDDSMRMP